MELDISVKVSQLYEIIDKISSDGMEYAYLEISESNSQKLLSFRAVRSKFDLEDKKYGSIKAAPELNP